MIKIFIYYTTIILLCTTPVFAQVVPKDKITTQGAISLLSAINELTKGECKGPPPAPQAQDTRVCEKYKLGALYGPLAVDLVHLQDVIKAVQDADSNIRMEVFGAPSAPPEPSSKEEKAVWNEKNNAYQTKYVELLKQDHPISLEHIKFADLNVGDPPKNQISPNILAGLSPIIDDLSATALTKPAETTVK